MGTSNQKQQASSKVAIPSQLMAVYKFRTAACASASSASSLLSTSASYINISNDCLLYVISFLTVSDWGTIARVSKHFYSLIDSNENWNLFCHSQFPKCDFLQHHQALLSANGSTFSMKHFFSNDLVPILLQANNQALPLQMNDYSDINNPVSSLPAISYVDRAFDLMIDKKLLCETNFEAMSLLLKHCHFLGPQALVNYLGMYDCTSEMQQDDSSQKRLIERFKHVTSLFFANEFSAYKTSIAQAQAHLMSLLSLENHFLHVFGPSATSATCTSENPLYYYLNSQQAKNIQLLFAKYYGEQCYPTLMQLANNQAEKIKLQSTSTANMYKYFFQDEQLRKAMVAKAHSCANFTIEEWEAGKLNSEQWVTDAKLVLLHTVLPLLGMRQHIGDAIGDVRGKDVANAYMSNFTLRGMFLPNAISLVFNSMTLPGEAQKIDRVCEFFAQAYAKSNNSAGAQDLIPFLKCSEPIYVISYSIIMLNTDYQVNKQNGMKSDEFIMNNMAVNDFGDFPREFFANIYWHVVNSRVI